MSRKYGGIEYGIIGLGRFGYALATSLAEAGKEVMVIDNTETKIKQIRNIVSEAFIVQDLERETLESTGIQNCQTVIVCIGEQIDKSILTTLNVISMGIPRVIAKATSRDQGCVLEKIGAEVVYPERDLAERLAARLLSPHALDFIRLNDDITVSEIVLTPVLTGQTVMEADLRRRFSLNIIALENGTATEIEVRPDYRFVSGDIVVVIGKKENIRRFEQYLSEGSY